MHQRYQDFLSQQLNDVREAGLEKRERVIGSPQSPRIQVGGHDVLNLCANNYLGLADHPKLVEAAHRTLDERGFGMASVRFICGTQDIHRTLEKRLSEFLGMDDTILYSSCFDANAGLFETLLSADDAIISDELNHASIIDGVRLCKAQRFRYRNNDMADLEEKLKEASSARFRLIATDGVFSMDGSLARLPDICDLADRYDAMVMVDDSHAVGFMGETGAGTPERFGVTDRIDVLTGTLGKALGGASGGYTSSKGHIAEWLRQRSRPYLFSNSVAPCLIGGALAALDLLANEPQLRTRLHENTRFFRSELETLGFDLLPGEHPIIPIMLGDAALASRMADDLLKRGVYVIGFSYPVVPKGKARIRVQISAAHTTEQLKFAVEQFQAVREEMNA